MSFGVDTAKLTKIVDLYSPNNHAQEMKYMLHLRGQEELFVNLQTCPFQGISNDSLPDRQTAFGVNLLTLKRPSLLQPLLSSISKPVVYFPLLLSFLAFVLQALGLVGDEGYRTIALVLLCLLNWLTQSAQGFWFRLRAAQVNRGLQECIAEVVRQNTLVEVDSRKVVVGDVLVLKPGVVIPADGWVVQGEEILVSQPYTAGSIELLKNPFRGCISKLKRKAQANRKPKGIISEESPVMLAGSSVKLGEGRMVVLCVGSNTKQARLHQYSQLTHHSNHTLLKIQKLFIGLLNSLAASLVFFFILFCLKSVYKASKSSWTDLLSSETWSSLIAMPWALVLGVPQGLQLGLLIGLYSIKVRLWKKEGIWVDCCCDISKMASVDLLCFDKSQVKQKTLYKEWWNEENHQQSALDEGRNMQTEEVDLEGQEGQEDMSQEFKQLFEVVQVFKQCQQPQQYPAQPVSEQEEGRWQFLEQTVNNSAVHYIIQSQAVKYVLHVQQSRKTVFVLGSGDDILQSSINFISKSTGVVSPLSSQIYSQINDIVSSMSRRLMCSLAVGYFPLQSSYATFEEKLAPLAQRQLTFLCLLGASGMREHSEYKIVGKLKQLGLKLMLVSDCALQQAEKRARQIGVNTVEQDTIALVGSEFIKLVQGMHCQLCKKTICVCEQKSGSYTVKSTEEIRKAQRFLRVVGQANAEQKYCLQLALHSIGSLTAYIGSLPQDIPAMAKCYLSITAQQELSQPAAVTLPRYDFNYVYELAHWSRFAHHFMSKAVQLALPASLVPGIVLLVGALACGQVVFELLPLIWTVGLVCPLLTLSLSLERPQAELLKEKQWAYSKQSHLLTWSIKKQIVCQILWQVLVLLVIMFAGHLFIPESIDSIDSLLGSSKYSSPSLNLVASGLFQNPFIDTPSYQPIYSRYQIFSRHLTVLYNTYTLMQIFNCFNCRKIKDTNINILEGIGLPSIAAILATFFTHFFMMKFLCSSLALYPEPLTMQQWFISIGLAMSVWLLSFAARLLPQEKNEADKQRRVNRSGSLAVKSTERLKQFSDFEVEEGIQFSQR